MPEGFKIQVDDDPLTVEGTIDMQGSEDLTIKIPKDSGKYFILIHPIT